MRNLLFLAVALAVLVLAAPVRAATLKPSALVDDDTVRVGDVFDQAGAASGAVLLRAPPPGRRYVLDAAWLADAALAHGLDWRPASRFDRVVVERLGRVVARAAMVEALLEALRRAGAAGSLAVELAPRTPEMAVPPQAPSSLEVQSLAFDPATGRFSAMLIAGGGHAGAQRLPVAGRAVATRRVPVLRRALQPGDIVRADDLVLADLREDSLRRDALAEPDRIVGQSARRALRAGEALREDDLRPRLLVVRNGLVTIVLKLGAMSLTAQGKSLDDGARGDTVRVVNVHSRRTIEAQVIGPESVTVVAGARAALAN